MVFLKSPVRSSLDRKPKRVSADATADNAVGKKEGGQGGDPQAEVVGQVQLRREIGLLEGVAITVGSIIGSGIFVSPKGVLQACGSVGLSIVIWILSGFLSMTGALCYSELGTQFPGSGGTYLYLNKAYGPTVAFIFLWITITISAPCSTAILSLTFAKYIAQAFFPLGCTIPESALALIAASTISIIVFINCYDVRGLLKAQNVFMVTKVSALALVIFAGLIYFFQGNTANFDDPFKNSVYNPGSISVAFYSGFFSYGGWSTLNFMTEELKSPSKNLPRAIYISLPLVTFIYVLANMAYFAVLSPEEMLKSDAIAVTFGQKLFGNTAWIFSLFVAISTFGALTINVMSSSRLLFVAAREGCAPGFLSHIKMSRLTPTPSIVFLGCSSLFYLSTSDIYALINYSALVDTIAQVGVITGLLYMRRSRKDMERPIKRGSANSNANLTSAFEILQKRSSCFRTSPLLLIAQIVLYMQVSLFHPIVYLLTCLLAVGLPAYIRPFETVSAILIALSGLPVYYFLKWEDQPKWCLKISEQVTFASQKLFMAVSQD